MGSTDFPADFAAELAVFLYSTSQVHHRRCWLYLLTTGCMDLNFRADREQVYFTPMNLQTIIKPTLLHCSHVLLYVWTAAADQKGVVGEEDVFQFILFAGTLRFDCHRLPSVAH